MYTQRRGEEGRSIPRNYSGNAFRYPPIGEPIPGVETSYEEKNAAPSSLLPIKEQKETVPECGSDMISAHSPKESKTILRRDGWGSEELLLLGLCFLLFGDGHSSFGRGGGWGDALPYLLFLLFLG